MMYDLPTSVIVCGVEYAIRSDYRAILDICIALADPEFTNEEKAYLALFIFYPAVEGYEEQGPNGEPVEIKMPPEHYNEALKRCYRFIDCDAVEDKTRRKAPRLVDWEKDFQYIIAPINRACGHEVRSVEYMHWWTFIAAFYEIGDCTFAQIVRIRDKKARGKPLDKADREWYRKNRHLVDIKTSYTETEKELLKMWGGA